MHTCKANNKVYIGIAKGNPMRRWGINGCNYLKTKEDGSYGQPAFAYALNKYPNWNNDWTHTIIAEQLTHQEACDKEVELIALYKSNCKRYRSPTYGYNMTDGGESLMGESNPNYGNKYSSETKYILSQKAKARTGDKNPFYGKHHSKESKNKISHSKLGTLSHMKGKHHSEETKSILSQYAKERLSLPENRPMLGKHHSEESKEKMRKSAQNRWSHGDEDRQNLSNKAKERLKNPENHPMYNNGKVIVQLDNNWSYINAFTATRCAERETGVLHGSISRSCKSKGIKLAGGFRWMYKEEYEEQFKNLN